MAAQTAFSVEMFPVSVPVTEDAQRDLPRNTLPAPQLVMLANVAAAESVGGGDGSAADEKEMMELKTVGCSYSDSEEENIVRYSYDNQNYREVCILEYPESPSPNIVSVVVGNGEEEEGVKTEDLSRHTKPHPPSAAAAKTPERVPGRLPAAAPESAKKKKPFHCKPCHFQAQNERQFVEHLGTHGASKMMVVNRVEGRSKTGPEAPAATGGEPESGEDAADVKGLIRCERCGYNTNRYDHYIAHLKHHSKEGKDHRVFKCTLCPYTTVSQYHWRKHLRNHFPSKLHTCSQCSYFSDRKSNYIQHIRTHTGVRPFQCPYCDYSSSQKTHLTRHMRTHSGERPFKCESCNYLAANQHEVTRHARQVHNGPKPLGCPYCAYKTADRSNFKKHVELHLNPRQFLCPLCKYAASKKCNLQYHIKSRHAGCPVALDVSKVKLRVKRPGADGDPPDRSSGPEEDFEPEDPSPINLSTGGRTAGAPDKPPKKPSVPAERGQKVKEKAEPEKRVTTRQKKTEKVHKSPPETETRTAAVGTDKGKRRVKKTTVQNQTAGPKPEHRPSEEPEPPRPEKERGPQRSENKSPSRTRKSAKNSPRGPELADDARPEPESPERETADKRKAAEALDLSPGASSEPRAKARRLRPAADDPKKTQQATPGSTGAKKTRNSSRKATSLQQPGGPVGDQKTSTPPPQPEETSARPACGVDPLPPAAGGPAPTFLKPGSPPLALPGPEDDEGIHSSHEGGSDLSDSASEGSDDSGLNGAGSAKMANDPETPTDEGPFHRGPAGLKTHLCIFCDRTFPLEGEYRRHLNRHLVNVYYLEDGAEAQR
ncbi:RE1-silencing transcription factor isoform X1 [Pseudoliparis swirei]|uniref:RE1-silencing transcription factor isoform X1 n=1 Tax=Pseudoliparis swirei TaxID=2059687 RepID=UPI0024BE5B05|nr:RE1-silencing transcription factor isoform X1 [Pseudoliparis swirei]XP_056296985.1 RE1-silencing transcription factor isoform X1 [Pseudoliparis swirei]XP_056296986.1 RE1-silencing transcription factor isoform X1 [Pseudoliparis swirei]XP_056296988.1 RE1-silencing transcription factor isoform X1 [Pseudoliparis swirei]